MSERASRLVVSRCFNHAEREASARCVACGRFFCRECVAEHEGRMICGACLRRDAHAHHGDARRWFAWAVSGVQMAAAVIVAWLVFYAAGRMLLRIPAEFHEGTVWQGEWWRGEDK